MQPGTTSTQSRAKHQTVVILDYGSQYTQLIARRIRESHVYCEIHPCTLDFGALCKLEPAALVLSGGPDSVYDAGSPKSDARIFELGVPVLGICYGQQLMAAELRGKVEPSERREYGAATFIVDEPIGLFSPFEKGDRLQVWMSHGDRLVELPPGFRALGHSEGAPLAAMADPRKKLYGIQFHPEVVHTPRGAEILDAFLFEVAGLTRDWTPTSFVTESVARIRTQVGAEDRVICALSGGVDSAVAAMLASRALGERLTCIFVDNGVLRSGEFHRVQTAMRDSLGLNVIAVDARERFLTALSGITDPEEKRRRIGRIFIEVFEEHAAEIAGVRYLLQGTLYPDVIESVSVKGPSAVIKTHHNVGGLPEHMRLLLLEPLRELFKDEVRLVGESLGMPKDILNRQPFPGPGLAIRCLGEVTAERLDILRQADVIVDEEIRAAGLYDTLWQTFAVLLPVRSVGVMGDHRTYESVCALRAVESKDAMTADWARLPYEVLARVSSRVINEVRGINRVVYDVSSKPPATIEWE